MYVCRRVTFWTLLQLERLLVDVLALVGHDYEGPRLTVLQQHGVYVCMYVCLYMLVCQRTSPAHRGMGTPPRELLQGSRLVAAHLLHFTATTVALDLQLPHIHTYIQYVNYILMLYILIRYRNFTATTVMFDLQ